MNKRILIVDDDERHAAIAAELLELEGYEVRVHTSPFGTSRVISAFRPHLLLLDVNMPGLSGDRLAEVLRTSNTTMPVVFYSSNDEESLQLMVKSAPVQGFICKGDPRQLRERVAGYLRMADRV